MPNRTSRRRRRQLRGGVVAFHILHLTAAHTRTTDFPPVLMAGALYMEGAPAIASIRISKRSLTYGWSRREGERESCVALRTHVRFLVVLIVRDWNL